MSNYYIVKQHKCVSIRNMQNGVCTTLTATNINVICANDWSSYGG